MKNKQKNKWLKAMSAALSCALLATAAPVGVLANEVHPAEITELSDNILDESDIPDERLYASILNAADKDGNGVLTAEEAATVESLSLSNADISNLKGIEYCTGLTSLNISGNKITDVSPLSGLTNLTSLDISSNLITDISALADLALKYGLTEFKNYGNNISNIGNFPERVVYDEPVEIRYLSDADKARLTEILGLSDYDGKIICIEDRREVDAYSKFYPYGGDYSSGYGGYGNRYDVLRTEDGKLTLGYNVYQQDNEGTYGFGGWIDSAESDNEKFTVIHENGNVWLLYCGNADSSGLTFTDTVETTTVVEPFAKEASGSNINKAFERDFGTEKEGVLNEQDLQTVMDYFGFSSYGGRFALISTNGSEYSIDFEASTYGKDELSELAVTYYTITRDENNGMVIDYLDDEWYTFQNGKLGYSSYHLYGSEPRFLTSGDIGTDIEDCTFYIPDMEEGSEGTVLIRVRLWTLNGYGSSNLITYNNARTIEVCNFTAVENPEEDTDKEPDDGNDETPDDDTNETPDDGNDETPDDGAGETPDDGTNETPDDGTGNNSTTNKPHIEKLPADNTTITTSQFAELLTKNETQNVVIEANGVSFTFAKGTMSAVEGMKNYDFGTALISDYANAGNMGSSVTKDNFVTRINYNYSGSLPAEASIKFYVGTKWAGKTLHYSHITENGFNHLQSVKVDAEGYVTVKQSHCSDYVLTTEKLDTTSPKTGDTTPLSVVSLTLVCGLGLVVFGLKKRNFIK